MTYDKSTLVEKYYRRLRAQDVRLTRQRKIVVNHLINMSTPHTAEEIHDALCNDGVSLTTIYRTLSLLKDLNLVVEMFPDHQGTKYLLKSVNNHEHHAVCVECGQFKTISSCPLQNISIRNDLGEFQVTKHRMEIYGVCGDCQAKL